MIATATSSYPIRTSVRVPARLPRSIPVSAGGMDFASLRLGRRERALAVMALASSGSTSFALAIPATFRPLLPPLCCRQHRVAITASRIRNAAGTIRHPMSRDVSPMPGQSRSGWRSASAGW